MPSHAAQPWLSAVGERTVVCCSPKVEPAVRQAAERVLAELRKFRADAVLLDPDTLATDYATLGTNHVICVGQWADNQVLRMTWGHWANSREAARLASQGRPAGHGTDGPVEEGHSRAGTGAGSTTFLPSAMATSTAPTWAMCRRSATPSPTLLAHRAGADAPTTSTFPRPFDQTPENQMYFVTDLTGTGPAGVVKAVEVYLRERPPERRGAGRGQALAGRLDAGRAGTEAVGQRPARLGAGGGLARGRAVPGAADARQPSLWRSSARPPAFRPQRMWRLKYLPGGRLPLLRQLPDQSGQRQRTADRGLRQSRAGQDRGGRRCGRSCRRRAADGRPGSTAGTATRSTASNFKDG